MAAARAESDSMISTGDGYMTASFCWKGVCRRAERIFIFHAIRVGKPSRSRRSSGNWLKWKAIRSGFPTVGSRRPKPRLEPGDSIGSPGRTRSGHRVTKTLARPAQPGFAAGFGHLATVLAEHEVFDALANTVGELIEGDETTAPVRRGGRAARQLERQADTGVEMHPHQHGTLRIPGSPLLD